MASLWKRKGMYYARYYVGGKQRSLSLNTASHQAAKEKLRRFETRLAERGDDALPTKAPVVKVLEAHIAHIQVAKTKAGIKSDHYYLRDIFGPVCRELEVKQKDTRQRIVFRGLTAGRECNRWLLSLLILFIQRVQGFSPLMIDSPKNSQA